MAADNKQKAKPSGGNAKRKAYYAAQFSRSESNQKRRMRRHIRANPRDAIARVIYGTIKNLGAPEALGLDGRGRRLERRR